MAGEKFYRGSLSPVPSVQEMVRNNPKDVPERYIQNREDRPQDPETSPVTVSIPIIDHHRLTKGDEDEREALDRALKEWGFFRITNHGADQVLQKMKAAAKAFFDLPLSEKKKYAASANDLGAYGQSILLPEDQKLDWNDSIAFTDFPHGDENMKYWVLTIPGFKEVADEYTKVMVRLTDEILGNISMLIGKERDFIKDLHGDMMVRMRMNYYPTCSRPDLVMGARPHSDISSITLLVQDDETTALQIKHMGSWVPIKPVPNDIVVNCGDAMEAWSNGMYKSIEHRAVTNEYRPRVSVAAFVLPGEEAKLDPLETMVNKCNAVRAYKNDKFGDYLVNVFAGKMVGKVALDYLKLET